MNHSETARLLGAMAAFDRRTVGDADVIAWQAVMEDIPLSDALAAVKKHYSEGEAWLMPVHIRTAVKAMQEEREAAARATGWAPGQAGVPKDQAMPEVKAITRLEDLPPDVAALVAAARQILPEGDRDALYPRRAAWEREHAAYLRTQNAEPNPLYKPKKTVCPICAAESRDLPLHLSVCHPTAERTHMDEHVEPVQGCAFCERYWRFPERGVGISGYCGACGARSQDLYQHHLDYPDDSCA